MLDEYLDALEKAGYKSGTIKRNEELVEHYLNSGNSNFSEESMLNAAFEYSAEHDRNVTESIYMFIIREYKGFLDTGNIIKRKTTSGYSRKKICVRDCKYNGGSHGCIYKLGQYLKETPKPDCCRYYEFNENYEFDEEQEEEEPEKKVTCIYKDSHSRMYGYNPRKYEFNWV